MNPLVVLLDPFPGVWLTGWFFFLCAAVLFLIQKYYVRIGLLPCLLWAYVLIEALYVAEFPSDPFGKFNPAFKYTAAQTAIELIVLPLFVLHSYKALWKLVPWFVAIGCVFIWIPPFHFLNGWESFDCAVMASVLLFVPTWLKVVVIATVASRHATTGLLIFMAQFFAYSIHNKRLRKYFLLLIPAAFFLIHRHKLNPNYDTGERWHEWVKLFTWWEASGIKHTLIGIYPGAFIWVSMLLDKFQPPLFLSAHCEYLQILIESGVIGLAFALGTAITAIKRCWHRPQILAAVLGILAFALSYHPFRFFASALLSAMIFRKALDVNPATDK